MIYHVAKLEFTSGEVGMVSDPVSTVIVCETLKLVQKYLRSFFKKYLNALWIYLYFFDKIIHSQLHDTIHSLPAVLNYSIFEWISKIILIDLKSMMIKYNGNVCDSTLLKSYT